MWLSDLEEQATKPPPVEKPPFQWPAVDWKLVVGIAFGALMWYFALASRE